MELDTEQAQQEQDLTPQIRGETALALREESLPARTGEEAPAKPRRRLSTREVLDQAFDKAEKGETDDEGAPARSGLPAPAGKAAPVAGKPAPAREEPEVEGALPAKAPQSWRADAREHWEKLPNEVRREIGRREKETLKVLSESATARSYAGAFAREAQPYLAMIQADGSTPDKAFGALLQTRAALQFAPPDKKAALVADLIRRFDVNIELLDDALVAGPAQQQPAPQQPQQFRDPRVDAMLSAQHAERIAVANAEIEAFRPEAPYLDDVRDTMADLFDAAEKRGQKLSLKAAYAAAVTLHPEVQEAIKISEARKAASPALQAAEAAKARAAGSGVRSQPVLTTPTNQERPKTMRGALEAAWDAQSA